MNFPTGCGAAFVVFFVTYKFTRIIEVFSLSGRKSPWYKGIKVESVTGSGTLKAGAVAVLKALADNPAAGSASAFTRDTDSNEDDTFFIDCVKPASGQALTVPAWAVNHWD